MWPNPHPADLVTFTEEILNGKLQYVCSVKSWLVSFFYKELHLKGDRAPISDSETGR